MSERARAKQPWLLSAPVDLALILGPAFLATAAAVWLGGGGAEVSPRAWLALVVGVDVAHVYATLFRWPAADAAERGALTSLFLTAALVCWTIGVLLHSLSPAWFWTTLAYAAAFHFVRQQYGFAMLYARGDREPSLWMRRLDAAVIYGATLYPLLWWHAHLPRAFAWFVEGDFVPLPWPWLGDVAGAAFALMLAAYVAKEAWVWRRARFFNWPKNLLILGTAASWYVGIVAFDGDLAFTVTNVVAHGIPYMALVWLQGRGAESPARAARFRWRWAPVALLGLLALAYLEEGLWDGFAWREHGSAFAAFAWLPQLEDPVWLSLLIPLLALPQATHYAMDGFIWRKGGAFGAWSKRLAAAREAA